MRWRNGSGACVLLGMALSTACTEARQRAGAVTRALALEADAAPLVDAPLVDAPLVDAASVDAGALDAGALDAGALPLDGAMHGASCCAASSSAGCADAQISACLCPLDPFCCSQQHDALCVREAMSSCGLVCEPPPPGSDCCSPSSSPGCTDAPVQSCVCAIDPACCQLRFDQSCAHLASARCGATCTSEGAP